MVNPVLQAAKRIYVEHGSTPTAQEMLQALIRGDETMLDHAIRMAAETALSAARHAARSVIVAATPAASAPKVFSREFSESVQIAVGRYYNFPLMDGTLLADATKDKLLRDSSRYAAQAAGCVRNARFLQLIADGLTDGRTVREVFTEERLGELMREARFAR